MCAGVTESEPDMYHDPACTMNRVCVRVCVKFLGEKAGKKGWKVCTSGWLGERSVRRAIELLEMSG